MSRKSTFKLVPNSYEMGLFRRTLSSRKRLRLTTATALAGLGALFALLGYFLRNKSQWPLLNIALIVLLFIFALAGAYLVALTLGDAFFPGPWREKMLKGERFVPETVEEQAALVRNRPITFVLVWLLSLCLVLAFGDLTSGFSLTWYQRNGKLLTAFRSTDAQDRLAVLEVLSNPLRRASWQEPEIRAALLKALSDRVPEVAAQAAYVAGRADLSEGASALENLAQRANWPKAQKEAILALGRLQWKSARMLLMRLLQAELQKTDARTELLIDILYALAELKDGVAVGDAINLLQRCREGQDCSTELVQYAFFYLKSLRSPSAVPLALAYFDDAKLDQALRCLAVDSLRFTAKPSDVEAMKARYTLTPIENQCPNVFRKYHKEALVLLFEADTMRALWLRAIGNQMQERDYDWLYARGEDLDELPETRKVAEIYIRAMNERFALKRFKH